MKILELSSRKSKGGRRKIEILLHKIPSDINEVNRNGIHWSEEFTLKNIDSVKAIPICAEFQSADDKEVPLGHGYTSTEIIDGKPTPIFENSEVVGTIDHGEIRDIEMNGETIRALVGTGYLYEQRYPKFVQWVKDSVETSSVDTSVEIVGYEENENKIIYEGEATDKYRIPKEYQYSGTAIISVTPADSDAIVLECAQAKDQNKEENYSMTEQEIMDVIKNTLNETNALKAEHQTEVDSLNAVIAEKESKISELNATVEQVQQAIANMESERQGWYAEREALEKQLGELRAEKRLSELNEMLSAYSEEEQKFAESEINSFKENPVEGDIESIKSKICVGIVEKRNAESIAEQNSTKEEVDVEDIFGEVMSQKTEEEEDLNIF